MKPSCSFKNAGLIVSMVAASLLGACAGNPPIPTEEIAVAEAAVQRANTARTRETAPGELQLAISKLDNAKEAVDESEYERAEQLAEQAEVDALVAERYAEAVRASIAAREAQEANRVLLQEINR